MYRLNPQWEKFYTELNPDKRKKIMNEILASGQDDGADEKRRMFFQKRHVDPKDPKRKYDLFLLQCVYLPTLYRKRKFFLLNIKREMSRSMSDMCLDQAEQYSEEERNALYWEIKNAARRYFKTCNGSKYGASLFGISKANEDQKAILAGRDAWEMAYGMPKYGKVEKEFQIFSDAVKDAFAESYEDGIEILEKAAMKHKNDK